MPPHPRRFPVVAVLAGLLTVLAAAPTVAQQETQRRPLGALEVDDLVTLLRIEDRRDFDAASLRRIAGSGHPELRRRAAVTLARLYDFRGRDLLAEMRADPDTAVLATVAWATGQLVDTAAVAWLGSLLEDPQTPSSVAVEAAGAFGKIRTGDTRQRLAEYLGSAEAGPATAPVVAEALLSIGRHRERGDLAPVARWTSSPDEALRWRAAWALFQPRNPAAIPHLLRLAQDPSPEVRSWAVMGLVAPLADSAGLGAAVAREALAVGIVQSPRRPRRHGGPGPLPPLRPHRTRAPDGRRAPPP